MLSFHNNFLGGSNTERPMAEGEIPNRIGMFRDVVIDVNDLDRSVDFWLQVFGGERLPATSGYARVGDYSQPPTLVLQKVPEVKTLKHRAHIDFRVDDLDASVEQVVQLGGRELNRISEHGETIAIMADPDGNEFCLIDRPDDVT